jgi:anti-sigma B factor antagonist
MSALKRASGRADARPDGHTVKDRITREHLAADTPATGDRMDEYRCSEDAIMQRKEQNEMTVRMHGEVAIVDVASNACLCDENDVPALILELLDHGTRNVVLNLARLPYIDSMGFGGLIRSYTSVARQGGRLKLLHAHERIQHLIEVMDMAAVLEVFASEEDAVGSFNRAPGRTT